MISTVADFLEEFKAVALSKIEMDGSDIIHRPTIGNIYEGLTSEILKNAIFKNLNLKIVQNSFTYNDNGEISDEIDCLLVVGNGLNIPFTNQFKYHIKDVIAVFQVKKNLYGKDIDDSHKNLLSIIQVSKPREPDSFVGELLRDAYKLLTSSRIPSREKRAVFTDRENIIYHTLMMEAYYPLRIVIGYFGYMDEYGLREGFINKLEDKIASGSVNGYGPGSFPNLYICGKNSIIKNNGMPIGYPFLKEEFYWPILISTNEKPYYYLLELIWTRLTYKFNLSSEIIGDDFHLDQAHKFLSCKEKKINENTWAWEYRYDESGREHLTKPLVAKPWTPLEVSIPECQIINKIGRLGAVNLKNDTNLLEYLSSNNIILEDLIERLVKNRILYFDNDKVNLLIDEPLIITSSDGKLYVGENKSGEMANYFRKQINSKSFVGLIPEECKFSEAQLVPFFPGSLQLPFQQRNSC